MINKFQTCDQIDDCLRNIKLYSKLAVGVSRHHILNSSPLPTSQMYCFDESQTLHSYFISMYVRRNHTAFKKIMDVTESSFKGGLFVKWTSDVNREQRLPYVAVSHGIAPLRVEHIAGGLVSFTFLTNCSLWAFLAEKLTHHRARIRNVHPFWQFIENIISPECIFFNGIRKRGWLIYYNYKLNNYGFYITRR